MRCKRTQLALYLLIELVLLLVANLKRWLFSRCIFFAKRSSTDRLPFLHVTMHIMPPPLRELIFHLIHYAQQTENILVTTPPPQCIHGYIIATAFKSPPLPMYLWLPMVAWRHCCNHPQAPFLPDDSIVIHHRIDHSAAIHSLSKSTC